MPRITAYHAPRRYSKLLATWTTEEQWAEVVELAARRDVSMAKIIRDALTEYLKVNSVEAEEFLDRLVLEQKAKAAELDVSGKIPADVARDHLVDLDPGEIHSNCDICIKIVEDYPDTLEGRG